MALDARARATPSSRARERRGDAASSATRAKTSSGIGGILLLALAGAVLAPIVSRFRRGDDARGGKKTVRGSRVKESSARANAPNVPRNKASNNKKNKARRAEKRAERERVEREEAERVKREAERAKKAKSNSVPKVRGECVRVDACGMSARERDGTDGD